MCWKKSIIIAGGRKFANYKMLEVEVIRYMKHIAEVSRFNFEFISGSAKGADSLGERFAINNMYQVRKFPANWNQFGKSAGFIRNEQMAKEADFVIVFWDGKSRGTEHMINMAKKYGLPCRIIKY